MEKFSLLLLSLALSLWAISGTVVDETGYPLDSVAVRLIEKDTTIYTDYSGFFYEHSYGTSLSSVKTTGKTDLIYTGKGIALSLDRAAQTSISIFNLRGQMIFSQSRKLASGTNMVSIPPLASGMYFVKVKIGSETFSEKILINGMSRTIDTPQIRSTERDLKIITTYNEIIDTLLFTKEGYRSVSLPIDNYDSEIDDVVMEKIPDGPVIEYNSLSIGYTRENFPTDRKDTVLLKLSLKNSGTANALSVSCSLSTQSSEITILNPVVGFNNITAGESTMGHSLCKVLIPRNLTPGYTIPFSLDIKDSWGGEWSDDVEYMPYPFSVDMQNIDDDTIPDSHGNNDGKIGVGEVIEYTPKLKYNGNVAVENISGELMRNLSFEVSPEDRIWSFGTMNNSDSKLPEYDYVFLVENDQIASEGYYNADMLLTGVVDGDSITYLLPISLEASEVIIKSSESLFKTFDKYETWAYSESYTESTNLESGLTIDTPITITPSPWESWMSTLSFICNNSDYDSIGTFDSLVISYSATDSFTIMLSDDSFSEFSVSGKSIEPGTGSLALTPDDFSSFNPLLNILYIDSYSITSNTSITIDDIRVYRRSAP